MAKATVVNSVITLMVDAKAFQRHVGSRVHTKVVGREPIQTNYYHGDKLVEEVVDKKHPGVTIGQLMALENMMSNGFNVVIDEEANVTFEPVLNDHSGDYSRNK